MKRKRKVILAILIFISIICTGMLLSKNDILIAAPNYDEEWTKVEAKVQWADTSELGIVPWGSTGEIETMPTKVCTIKDVMDNDIIAYEIYTAEELRYALINQLNMKIMSDIDLGGKEGKIWTSSNITNNITIDGNNKTIYNLSGASGLIGTVTANNFLVKDILLSNVKIYNAPAGTACFINRLARGYIYNCAVENALVKGANILGGFVSNYDVNTVISDPVIFLDNCYTKNVHVYGSRCSSNFAEDLWSAKITNCYAIDGTIIVPGGHSGGFTSCSRNMICENSYTNVDVYGSSETGVFVGMMHQGQHSFTNCFSAGKIEGTTTIGGFTAQIDSGGIANFSNCYSTSMVGMQDGGTNMGGFVGVGGNMTFNNCYAAGEVGTEVTDPNDITSVRGFTANNAGTLINCYYDKQTTAMREKGGGTAKGLLTKELMQTLPDGLSASASAWVLTDGAYPQLKVFTEASQIFDNERDVLTALAYSEASASTAVLYPSNLEKDEYNAVIQADNTNYDTVRDIRFVFPFTNNAMVKNDDFDIYWWADDSYTCNVEGMVGLPIISLKDYPDFGVDSLTPGVGWASVSVYLPNAGVEYQDIVGKRNLRLVPRTALTVAGGAGTDETIYALPTEPDGTSVTTGWEVRDTEYDHRDNVYFTYVNSGESVETGAKVAAYPVSEKAEDVSLSEDKKTIRLDEGSLKTSANETVAGKVDVTVTKNNETIPIVLTKDLLEMLYGEREAQPEDIGIYTLTYRWYAGGNATSYLESQKKLTVKEAYWLDYRYNYIDSSQNLTQETAYYEDPGAYRDGDKISNYEAIRISEPYTYPVPPQRAGYTFLGWSTEKDGFGAENIYKFDVDTEINQSLVLYAQWRAIDYSLSYDGNGNTDGTAPVDTKTYNITDTATVQNKGSLVKKNHTFVGWNTEANGNGDWYYPDKNEELTFGAENVTLYAQWVQNKVTTADVSITKTVKNETSPAGPTRVGDILEYTIIAKNNSDSIWRDVVLSDILSAGLDLVPGSINLTDPDGSTDSDINDDYYDTDSRTIESPAKNLELNETYTLVFKAVVTSAAMDIKKDNLGNKAAASGADYDDEPVEVETPKIYPPDEDGNGTGKLYWKDPDSYIQKSVQNNDAPNGPTTLGDELTYTIVVGNRKMDSLWRDVLINDILPEGITFVPDSITGQWNDESQPWEILDTDGFQADYKDGKSAVVYNVGDIAGGKSFTLTFKAIVNEKALSESINNEKIMNQASADGKKPYGEDEDEEYEGGSSDKVYPPDGEGGSGGKIRYKNPDGYYAKAIVKKTGETDSTAVEDILTYTITAENKKKDSLWADVSITDVLPGGMELVPGSIYIQGPNDEETVQLNDEDVYDSDHRTLKYHIGPVYGNEVYELTFDVVITANAMDAESDTEAHLLVRNTASITGKTPVDENEGGETDPIYPPGTGDENEGGDGGRVRWRNPKGSIKKAVANQNQDEYSVIGDTLEYTLTAENTASNSCWENVLITDKLPKGMDYVSDSAILIKPDGTRQNILDEDIYNKSSHTISYLIGNLHANEKYELVFEVILNTEAVLTDANGNDQVGNTVYASGKRPDGEDENHEHGKIYPPGYEEGDGGGVRHKEPDGSISKKVYGQNEGLSTVGDTLEYILTAENHEYGSLWKDVVITDKLPLGLTFVDGSVKAKGPKDQEFQATDTYTYDETTRIFQYQIGNVYGGETYAVFFEVMLNESAVSEEEDNPAVWNTAEISGGTPGGKTEDDESDGVYPPDGKGKEGDGGKTGRIRYKDPKSYYTKAIVEKTGNPDSTTVGDILTYTISAENKKANSLWSNVEITDQLPLGMELIPNSIYIQGPGDETPVGVENTAYDAETRTLRYVVEKIYGNERYELSFDVVITAAALEGESDGEALKRIGNVAVVSGEKPDGTEEGGGTGTVYPPGTDEEDGGHIRFKNPSGKVEKQVKNLSNETGITVVDDILEYTLLIENDEADSLWEKVLVEDELPAGTSFVSGSARIKGPKAADTYVEIADEDIYLESEGRLSYVIDKIYGGEVYTIVFQVQVNGKAVSDTEDTIGNEFTAEGDTPDGGKERKRSPKVYPPGVKEPGGSGGGGNVQWKDPRPKFTKTVRNEAGRVNATVGDILTYALTISNHEKDSVWENVIVHDDLPEGTTFVPGSLKIKGPGESEFTSIQEERGYQESEHRIEYALGDVYGNETYIIEFSVIINEKAVSEEKENEKIANSAAANGEKPGDGGSAEEVDGPVYPGGEEGDPTGRVRYKNPDPEVTKRVTNNSSQNDPTQVGDILTYTITAGNQKEHSLWSDVTVYDKLPIGMTFIDGSAKILRPGSAEYESISENIYDSKTRIISYEIGRIYGKEVYELCFDVQINEAAVTDGDNTTELVGNQAWAEGKRPDGTDENTDKTDPVLPPGIDEETRVDYRKPVGEITKNAENKNRRDATTVVGDMIEYTISVSNGEEYSIWRDALLKDDMPEGLSVLTETMVLKTPSGQQIRVASDAYDEVSHTIALYIGDIAYGETYTLTFQAEVTPEAIGANIGNLAVAWTSLNRNFNISLYTGYPYSEGIFGHIPENEEDRDGQSVDPGEDDYVYVEVPEVVYPSIQDDPKYGNEEGDPDKGTNTVLPYNPEPDVSKEAENLTHPDGDTRLKDRIRYTITLSNKRENSTWNNISIMDYLPQGMMLDLGSMVLVHPNGTEQKLASSVYNNSSRLLMVPVKEIKGGESYTLIYEVEVYVDDVDDPENENAIVNTVKVPGENPDGTPTDETPEDSAKIDYPKDAKKRPRGSVEIVKVDSENDQILLAGAKFLLYWYNPEAGEYQQCRELETTGGKKEDLGKILFTDLPEGKYKLVELIAPDNYKKPIGKEQGTYFELSINEEENALILHVDDREYTSSSILIPNEKLEPGDLQITKVEKDYHENLLEGAQFKLEKLKEAEEEVPEEIENEVEDTSDKETEEEAEIEANDVEVKETEAQTDVETEIGLEELPVEPEAEIHRNEIPEVQTGDDAGVETFWKETTDKDGILHFRIEEPGSYRLTEIAAPKGYLLGDTPFEVTFEVKEENGKLVISSESWSYLVENKAEDPIKPKPPVDPKDPEPDPKPDPVPSPDPIPETPSETEKETEKVRRTEGGSSARGTKNSKKVPLTADVNEAEKMIWLLLMSGFAAVLLDKKKRLQK